MKPEAVRVLAKNVAGVSREAKRRAIVDSGVFDRRQFQPGFRC